MFDLLVEDVRQYIVGDAPLRVPFQPLILVLNKKTPCLYRTFQSLCLYIVLPDSSYSLTDAHAGMSI